MLNIHDLYNLVEGHIITPAELLANAKLPNYEYVKYSNNGIGLHVETLCSLEDNSKAKFNYYFDNQDRLLKLTMEEGARMELLFDREAEIKKAKTRLRNSKSNKSFLGSK